MPDILDEDLPEPELSKRDQKRADRAARKTARWQGRAAVREREQLRRRRAFAQQRSPIVLAVLAVLVFGGIAVVGALVPRGDDAGGDVKVLHQDTAPTTVTTDAGATSEPSSDATDTTPQADPQTVGADWVVAYFSGGDWQQLTTPAARKALDSTRGTYFDGKYLDGDKVNVSEWTWRDQSTVSPQWEGTIDVLLQPGRDARLVASLRVTVDTTGSTPLVSKVDTLFYGEA